LEADRATYEPGNRGRASIARLRDNRAGLQSCAKAEFIELEICPKQRTAPRESQRGPTPFGDGVYDVGAVEIALPTRWTPRTGLVSRWKDQAIIGFIALTG